jgi:hypothetical protein
MQRKFKMQNRIEIRSVVRCQVGALLVLCCLVTGAAQATPISHTRTLHNVNYVVAGAAGVGGGTGTITIAGVSGTVTKAYLYWHGINNTGADAVYNNPTVTINGNSVTGVAIGDASTNCWGAGSSRAFEADATAFVSGNGPYTIAGLSSCAGCNANGASLVVVFNDGNPANDRDLAFFTGNDSNYSEGFPGETDGWHAVSTPISYAGGPVRSVFHVADGQSAPDDSITFTTGGPPLTIPDSATLWDGNSLPSAGTSRAGDGDLWDIHTFDITAAFGAPGPTTLHLDGQENSGDCLGLVLMLLDLEPGSAPPPPPPTSGCQLPTSIRADFNGTPIASNRYIWFNSVFKPSGLGSTPVTFHFTQQTISSSAFTLSVPDAIVTFDPAATSASTTFTGGMWITRVPASGLAGNTFLSGLGYLVPGNIPGGLKNVTWSATVILDTPGTKIQWQWAAAVYKTFSSDNNALGIKPVDDNKASSYKNSDHAGTPENFKSSVTQGARGGGGANYTGGYSGTAKVGPCPQQTPTSSSMP